ncbi:hypothetical protein [Corynebacterium falsenii]|uniref:hypothetical protein n=1 Tax=Corynebacterium falsenii TaxID=108486 RepID=UPI0003E9582D|nr:hypothetical protein [Corynebacterium falsenii]AHI03746.1 hypothetical protein CFAL_09130 [Corynebacterium falsenii DSM 44353]UBI04474.1 acyl-CoA carboxylase subunit epsilon [Corynebacterium falsenii]UBI07494.1 acyl-CoA carboxylase subunit epsilon [Corynebacterium falsenii]HJF11152.1 acyl-CoA carboxylase subunit epsilon [Corynebacterium falsenii]
MTDSSVYKVVKGQLDDTQLRALHRTLDGIAEQAHAMRHAKPHTRGHFGTHHALHHANPLAFRNPRLPRA